MFFFNLVVRSLLVHKQIRIFNVISFKVFQAISEFAQGNMELRC